MNPNCLSKSWIREQTLIRNELLSARGSSDDARLRSLVDRVLHRYEDYYRVRSDFARSDPAHAYCAPQATGLERAAYWVAGWRPTTLIHLLYTESGLKFEAQLEELLSGAHSGDIGDISPTQLGLIDELQGLTVKDEISIEEELGWIQEGLPDPFPLSDSDLDLKMQRIGRVMEKADGLRMETLGSAVRILNPLQAVELLVAAADLEIGVRKLGLELERHPIRHEI